MIDPPAQPAPDPGWHEVRWHRRVIARAVDASWQAAPVIAVLWKVVPDVLSSHWALTLGVIALSATTVQLIVEPALLTTFGSTPGKALCRLVVVGPRGTGRLRYPEALARTLKVVAWGHAFWILPLVPATVARTVLRLRRAQALPWDKRTSGPQVVTSGDRAYQRSVAAVAGLAVPALLLAVLSAWLTVASRRAGWTAVDIRRFLAGEWTFVHSVTGADRVLSAAWRTSFFELSLQRGVYRVTLTRDSSPSTMVTLYMRWPRESGQQASSAVGGACPMGFLRLDLEEQGFLLLDERPIVDGSVRKCRVLGGRAQAQELSRVVLDIASDGGLVYEVAHTWPEGNIEARDEAGHVAAWLLRNFEVLELAEGRVVGYHWLNLWTARTTRLPAFWEATLASYSLTSGEMVQEFRRLEGFRSGPRQPDLPIPTSRESFRSEFTLKALPDMDADAVVAQLTTSLRDAGYAPRRRTDARGDLVLGLTEDAHNHYRAVIVPGRRFTWLMWWTDVDAVEPEKHELFQALRPTLE